jgi:hypothetical protein
VKTRDDLGDWIWDDRDPLEADPLGDPLAEGILAAAARRGTVALPADGESKEGTGADGAGASLPKPHLPRAMARRHWQGWSVRSLIVTGLIVVAIFVGAVVPQVLPKSTTGEQRAGSVPSGTQRVVAWSVSDGDGPEATYLAVVAAGGPPPVALAIPGHATISVPGQGLATAGEVAVEGDGDLIRLAMSNLLGVTVDVAVATSMFDLRKVVDGIGGIELLGEVMDGRDAARYLTRGPVGEERFLRWQDVLEKLLPAAADRTEGLAGLPARLTSILDRAASAGAEVVPLPVLDLGGGLYRPDVDAVERLVAEGFEDGRTLEQEVLLVVLNGVGVPGIGEGVAEILVPEGFRLVASSNANTFGLEETRIIASSQDDLGAARRARDLLGVGQVQVGNQSAGLADVTVVVGRDFGRP